MKFIPQDIVKNLSAQTQTALLHVNGARVNRGRLRRYLNIYQSSSPSYVLMAGMDACLVHYQNAALFMNDTPDFPDIRHNAFISW